MSAMRRANTLPLPAATALQRHDWLTIKSLLPYLLAWKWRVLFALLCLVAAKVANVAVPLVFKGIVDALSITPARSALLVPLGLLAAYGGLRFATSILGELREIIFARVSQRAVRTIALQVFNHLHALSLRFHLERQTGALTRDIERGTRAIGSLLSYTLYSILPTLVEIGLVLGILLVRYEASFALITLVTLAAYIIFTVTVTNWRTQLRRQANEIDSAANSRAIDSLLNYETVKYFNNERWEAERYDAQMQRWEAAQVKTQVSLSFLNMGQAAIISSGVALMMWRASVGVAAGEMTVGDIVLVNAFLIQLYIPLNFLGVLYREIRQALADIERLFLLKQHHLEVQDAPDAQPLVASPGRGCHVRFKDVHFSYDGKREVLHGISFDIPAGTSIAVVGHSGSGKSTLSRLLYRFYEVGSGAIEFDGRDVRTITQSSLRAAIGIVPQDTVLFNDTLFYNIQYGRPTASADEVRAAARAAQLEPFIQRLHDGESTQVGERGLKLSGGEKQRVAIARALLKNPPILIFDEATSALDSKTEQAIQTQLDEAAQGRTSLIIAHRLSTVMKADRILVLDQGRIIEQGNHSELLNLNGTYAQMWALQAQAIDDADPSGQTNE